MTQFNANAAKLRTKFLLCCSAAILLSACGGNVDPGSEQLTATAASVTAEAGAPAAAAGIDSMAPAAGASPEAAAAAVAVSAPATVAEAAPAAGIEAAPAASANGATSGAADARAQAFELSGYGSTPLQAQDGQQDAGAAAPVPIKQ